MSRRAAFLDRDGTLNVRPRPHEYVRSPQEFTWLPGAREGLAELAAAGYVLAIVSNQRGVARGLMTPEALAAIDERVERDLRPYGAEIRASRYCLHDEGAGCACRKPRPGMLLDLARSLQLDLARSWMIGDADADVAAGKAAGCRTALIGDADASARADLVCRSLAEAAHVIAAETRVTAGGQR